MQKKSFREELNKKKSRIERLKKWMNSILAVSFLITLFLVYQFNELAKIKEEINALDDDFFELLISKISKNKESK